MLINFRAKDFIFQSITVYQKTFVYFINTRVVTDR